MTIGEEIGCDQTAPPAGDHGRLGGYDISNQTQSLAGLHELEERVAAAMEELAGRYPDGVPAGVVQQFRSEHDLYYRVRAHERAHYYQGISAATELALTFARNDLTSWLFQTLAEVPDGQGIWIPLLRWARGGAPGCPAAVRDMVNRLRIAEVVYAALDGDPAALGLDPTLDDLIRSYFPGGAAPLGSDPGFRLGRRYLAEGAAKAAEWIYFLRDDPSDVTRAELDLASSGEVYRRAIRHVRQLIPAVPLAGQLQATVLAADLALHPVIPDGLWPDIYAADPEEATGLAPGPRFVAVTALLPGVPAAAFEDKETLGAELEDRAVTQLGWPSAEAATRAVLAALHGVMERPYHSELLGILDGTDHPIRKMVTAGELRLADQFAFVPPLNAQPINENRLAPSGFRGSIVTPLGEIDRLLAPERLWYRQELARQLVYAQCPRCPLRGDDSYQTEFLAAGACRALESGACQDGRSRARIRQEFLGCDLTAAQLGEYLGEGWRSRLRFFESSQEPGIVSPPPYGARPHS
jgi:hypothetical protein